MQDTYSWHTYEDGIVDEIGNGIDGLIASHPSYVDVLLEIKLTVINHISRIVGYVAVGTCYRGITFFCLGLVLGFGGIGMFQTFGSHLGLHISEDDGGHLAVNVFNCPHTGQSLDAHGVANLYWGLGGLCRVRLSFAARCSTLCGVFVFAFLLCLAFLPAFLSLLYLLDFAIDGFVVA